MAFHSSRETGKNTSLKEKKVLEAIVLQPSSTTEKSAQNKSLGFLRLHAANDAHRKYCREKVPEKEAN